MYEILSADCPWRYANWKFAANGAQRAHYEGMTIEELEQLPVGQLAAKDSICLFWVTGPKMMENAHTRVLSAWGFRAATIFFVWVKTYREPQTIEFSGATEARDFASTFHMEPEAFKNVKTAQVVPGNWSHGNGFYTSAGTEFLVLGVRGKALPRRKLCEKQILVAPRTTHSAKPNDEVRKRLKNIFPDYDKYNKIELFARPPVPSDWVALGNEIDGKDIRVSLQEKIGAQR